MRSVVALLIWLLWAPVAWGLCQGQNMLAELEQTDPAAHTQILTDEAAVLNGDGILWKITKDDTPPSYLFGTLHLAEAVPLAPPRLWDLVTSARVLLVETTEEDWEAFNEAISPADVLIIGAEPLSAQVPPDTWQALTVRAERYDVPLDMVDILRPSMLFVLLGLPACVQAQYADGEPVVLDEEIMRRAKDADVPIRALERITDSLAGLDRAARADVVGLIVGNGALDTRESDAIQTALDLYAEGRNGGMTAFELWVVGVQNPDRSAAELIASFDRWSLDFRNKQWIEPMVPELAKGGVVVAVGAGHLPGENGLVALLRAQGFRVERLH